MNLSAGRGLQPRPKRFRLIQFRLKRYGASCKLAPAKILNPNQN